MIRILLSQKLGALRMPQADLARMTGIRANTICDLYNELCDRVSLEQLDRICEALHCDLSDILQRTPPYPRIVCTRAGFKGPEQPPDRKPGVQPADFPRKSR